MKIKSSSILLVFSIFLLPVFSSGQPFSLDERVKPTELNMVDYKKTDSVRKGKINISEITQNNDTAYYFVKGLSMFSPAYFGLTTNADAGNIRVNLCKDNWHQVNQNGETGDKGHWGANFKTEGDFGIMVIAENKPADYSIIVWVGDEVKDVGIPSPFKDDEKVSTAKKKGNFFRDNLVIILVALAVIIGVVIFLKRKKN